jgi:hypothetical protein
LGIAHRLQVDLGREDLERGVLGARLRHAQQDRENTGVSVRRFINNTVVSDTVARSS